ncbi:hypothetical protein D5Y30_23340 [Salmonella enterica subsp. enterica serovar Oranienburg]|nr:hypothetical protein [Salmonella enterica subsp. enterica serovar Oranienburg]
MMDKLQYGQTYALHLSFGGKGDYLRTDGLNSAGKVYWNTTTDAASPCLTSPAQDALVLKQLQNISEFANLQVEDVTPHSVVHHLTNASHENLMQDSAICQYEFTGCLLKNILS